MNPAHTPELDEDEDDQLVVRSDCNADSEDKDDKPLVRSTTTKEPVEEKRESVTGRRIKRQVRRKKRTASLARPTCHTGTRRVRKLT